MPPKYVPVGTSGRWEVDSSSNCGEGGFGMVYRGRDKGPPPKDCAFKRVPLSEAADIASFKVETETLAVVHGDDPCPHIIQMHGHERIGNDGWLFLEMATGGELFDRLIDYGSLKEGEAWPFISKIAAAIEHCYARGIIHRDLKLENVMLDASDPSAIKLIDFGLALQLPLDKEGKVIDELQQDTAGTQAYRAPEVNTPASDKGHSPLKVDVWALGIVAFSLVAGFFPLLEAKSSDWRFKKLAADQAAGVGACESVFKTYKRACPFSADLKALLDGMLTIDQEKRMSVEEVVQHKWIANTPPTAVKGDGKGGRPVYRGTHDDDDELMEEEIPIPEEAIPLQRQKANRVAMPI